MIIEKPSSPTSKVSDSAEMSVDESQAKVFQTMTQIHERRRRKVVSFFPEVIMTETLHHKNYSDTERAACWYSKEDFAEARREYTRTLKLKKEQKENEFRQDEENCFRGLEFRILDRAIQRRNTRTDAWMAVFHEQAAQRHKGVRNEDVIAARYFLISRACAFEAYNTGIQDEIEAFRNDDSLKQMSSKTLELLETQPPSPKIQQGEKGCETHSHVFSGIRMNTILCVEITDVHDKEGGL
eukprot:CAMPEP_0178938772 /NCGR_PEP_ID=MMETSP0786-20121207/26515_1 /TAXON_ID=186022 /ORGANISM="Thalassionema frauenfeldii, Strain CCMP 1798" /LENGTH=239 /DNA_ID=CAMNT_0020617525 /DNA_START=6 /DNA_END=726 /DNA_ORIENTATION=+